MVVLPARVIREMFSRCHLGFFQDAAEHLVDRFNHHTVQGFQAPRLLGEHDAGDDILAVADLAVEIAVLGQHPARDQVHQLTVHRGGADIHGHGVILCRGVARLHIDDIGLARTAHGRARVTVTLKSCSLKPLDLAYDGKLDDKTVFVVMQSQVIDQAGDVGQVILGIGQRKLQVKFFHRRQKEPLGLDLLQPDLFHRGGAPGGLALQGRCVNGDSTGTLTVTSPAA
jgi:hypothetical protein